MLDVAVKDGSTLRLRPAKPDDGGPVGLSRQAAPGCLSPPVLVRSRREALPPPQPFLPID